MAVDALDFFSLFFAAGAIMFAVFVVLYVYFALALQTIAQKAKTKEPAWLAWIPIANLYLTVRIAGFPGWYFLGFFLSIIPFIGWILYLAFAIYVFWKVSEKLKFPGWMGILMVIPIVNLITIGILAWGSPK